MLLARDDFSNFVINTNLLLHVYYTCTKLSTTRLRAFAAMFAIGLANEGLPAPARRSPSFGIIGSYDSWNLSSAR
jgi:hypothetical protein